MNTLLVFSRELCKSPGFVASPRRFKQVLWVIFALFFGAEGGAAYSLNGYVWPTGSQISMHLGLSHSPLSFQDGSTSWNGSATDALNIWNQYIGKVQFVASGATSNGARDGQNSVFFSTTMYGQAFGARVLAVTFNYSGGFTSTETDVIFNDRLPWSSYRGPLQGSAPDFHRVALHEFGHVLGLDHPDEHGQSVTAIMNSVISNLDSLASDDIAGARSLYGLSITSAQYPQTTRSGDQFSYQVTANNDPVSYSASGLPPGLQINSATGLISGRCTTSGVFDIAIVVQGNLGTATGQFRLTVNPLSLTSTYSPPAVVIGDSFSYQITAGNNPTSFSATGLPPGLTLNALTGLISGTASTSGNFAVVIKATGPSSEAGGTIYITISPPSITSSTFAASVNIGSNFTYQITANNHPISFSAPGLPSGLSLNPSTGLISGVATLSGSFQIRIGASGTVGEAAANLSITVIALATPTTPIAQLSLNNNYTILADPARDRIYVLRSADVLVLDAKTFVTIAVIPNVGAAYGDLCLSADGRKLWVSDYYSPYLKSVDLESLTALPYLLTSVNTIRLREGADGRLYALAYSDGGIFQIDPATGSTLAHFSPDPNGTQGTCVIALSPDHKTLYAAAAFGNSLVSYDVSGPNGPVLLQRVPTSGRFVSRLDVSPDGRFLIHTYQNNDSAETAIRSTADLSIVRTTLSGASNDTLVIASQDSNLLFRTGDSSTKIVVHDLASGAVIRSITMPERVLVAGGLASLAIDRTNSYVFVIARPVSGFNLVLYVFPVTLAPSTPVPPKSLLNVSTRLRSQTGDNVLIGGFIISGAAPKKVVVRAIGPSLPTAGKMADPVLELRAANGSLVAENDNWNLHRADVLASQLAPSDEHESAIVATLEPGAYTTILRGLSGSSGVALVELYDLDPQSNSRMANISTRGRVETGDNVMIGGFIVGGDQLTRVVVRAIGPSLSAQGVSGALSDPTLTLYDGNGTVIAMNDDWQSNEQEISATNLPPTDPREAAIVQTLAPGAYTAIVRGKNETSGVALVEAYNLEGN